MLDFRRTPTGCSDFNLASAIVVLLVSLAVLVYAMSSAGGALGQAASGASAITTQRAGHGGYPLLE